MGMAAGVFSAAVALKSPGADASAMPPHDKRRFITENWMNYGTDNIGRETVTGE